MSTNNSSTGGCPFAPLKEYRIPRLKDEYSFRIVREQFGLSLEQLAGESVGKWRKDDSEVQSNFMDVNAVLRKNYNQAQEKTGLNIYPMVIASEIGNRAVKPDNLARQGVGGTYTLFLSPQQMITRSPVHKCYELMKICSHIVVGVYTIIEPYLDLTVKHTTRRRFYPELARYRAALFSTHRAITQGANGADLGEWRPERDSELYYSEECKQCMVVMLRLSYEYCDRLLGMQGADGRTVWTTFQEYCSEMRPHIKQSMILATELQARGVIGMLVDWKKLMTEQQWRDLYLIIPAVWVTSKNSCREQCFRFMMDKENQNTHIIIGENLETLFDSRKLVGRVVHDRLMSRIIFGTESE